MNGVILLVMMALVFLAACVVAWLCDQWAILRDRANVPTMRRGDDGLIREALMLKARGRIHYDLTVDTTEFDRAILEALAIIEAREQLRANIDAVGAGWGG